MPQYRIELHVAEHVEAAACQIIYLESLAFFAVRGQADQMRGQFKPERAATFRDSHLHSRFSSHEFCKGCSQFRFGRVRLVLRKRDQSKDGDDGDDHHQFDQGEACLPIGGLLRASRGREVLDHEDCLFL